MKGFFRSKRGLIVAAYDRLMMVVETTLRRWAAVLNKKSAGFSARQLTVGLVVFCIVFGSAVAFTIWQSLNVFADHRGGSSVSVPKHLILKDSMVMEHRRTASISRARIKVWLDSVKKKDDGHKLLKKMQSLRPGLLDSLKMLENIK